MSYNINFFKTLVHGQAQAPYFEPFKGWAFQGKSYSRLCYEEVIHRVNGRDELSNMILWLDETSSDKRSERRRFGYHLRGITPASYNLSIREKRMSSIAIMSSRGIEDVNIYDGCISGEIFTNFIARSLLPILQPFDGKNPRSVVEWTMHPCITLNRLQH